MYTMKLGEGAQSLICEECYNIIRVNTSVSVDILSPEIHASLGYHWTRADLIHHSAVQMECPHCGSSMFWCDAEISDIIVNFNKLGFPTHLCCVGHGAHSRGYVLFDPMPYAQKKTLLDAYDFVWGSHEKYPRLISYKTFRHTPDRRIEDCSVEDELAEIDIRAGGMYNGYTAETKEDFISFLSSMLDKLRKDNP